MGKKKVKEPTDALADATPEELLEAQQESLDTGVGLGVGYVGTMSPDEKAKEADRLEGIVNHAEDKNYRPRVAPPVLGRDPDADDLAMEEGGESGPSSSRVGFRSVVHPRASLASAMHDWLDGARPSDVSADELSEYAGKVGMNVEASGANGAVLKSDLVRAFDDLASEYPAPAKV